MIGIAILTIIVSIVMTFSLRNNVCDTWFHYNIKHISSSCSYNPNVGANTVELATRFNYEMQTHHVETKDGYILTIYRIANNMNSFNSSRRPIFLQHGTISESGIWLQRGHDSIGFLLSNMGLDVWLGNTRGNNNSAVHKIFSTYYSKYWDQTFDDLVEDISTVMDYIAKQTDRAGDILYLGYSVGGSQGLAYASDRPEHAKRNLKAILSIAPAVYFSNISLAPRLIKLLSILPINKIDIHRSWIGMFCTLNTLTVEFCKYFLTLNFGMDSNMDPALFPLFIYRYPDRQARKTFVQYVQVFETNEFKKFDYGLEENLRKYGSANPPKYDLAKVPIPVYTFIGTEDKLTTLNDTRKFHNELLVENKIFELENYTHITHYISNNVHVLYKPLFSLVDKLNAK